MASVDLYDVVEWIKQHYAEFKGDPYKILSLIKQKFGISQSDAKDCYSAAKRIATFSNARVFKEKNNMKESLDRPNDLNDDRDLDAMYRHTENRLKTMNPRALTVRMQKITDPLKMYVFAQALSEYGYIELAKDAYSRLEKMGYNKQGKREMNESYNLALRLVRKAITEMSPLAGAPNDMCPKCNMPSNACECQLDKELGKKENRQYENSLNRIVQQEIFKMFEVKKKMKNTRSQRFENSYGNKMKKVCNSCKMPSEECICESVKRVTESIMKEFYEGEISPADKNDFYNLQAKERKQYLKLRGQGYSHSDAIKSSQKNEAKDDPTKHKRFEKRPVTDPHTGKVTLKKVSVGESQQMKEFIEPVKGGFRVISHQTGKNFGTYKTRAEAEKRLAQIHRFAKKEESNISHAVKNLPDDGSMQVAEANPPFKGGASYSGHKPTKYKCPECGSKLLWHANLAPQAALWCDTCKKAIPTSSITEIVPPAVKEKGKK